MSSRQPPPPPPFIFAALTTRAALPNGHMVKLPELGLLDAMNSLQVRPRRYRALREDVRPKDGHWSASWPPRASL